MRQQPAFPLQTAAIAGEVACCANNSMTRDDDGNRVRAIGEPHGASAVPEPEPACDDAVRRRLSWRDLEQTCPHAALELRPMHGERQYARVGASTGEVVVEPGARPVENRVWCLL